MKNREKKHLYYKFFDDKTLTNWQIYKHANKEGKKVIAVTRAVHYDKFDTQDGERSLYRLVKSQHQRTQGIEFFCCVHDNNENLLSDQQAVTNRLRELSSRIQTKELLHPQFPQALPTVEAFQLNVAVR